jgi:hypothetical protein
MPSKSRWALNPRKWFGTISNAAQKREQKTHMNVVVKSLPSTSTVPSLLTSRSKTKVIPVSTINDNNYANSTAPVLSFTQFQLPPFNVRREKTSTLITTTSTLTSRTNTFVPTRIEPSIRKSGQSNEILSVDATRWTTQAPAYDTSKLLLSPSISSPYGNFSQQNSTNKQSEINISNLSSQCLIDFPRSSSNNFIEKCSSPARSHSSSSSLDDNDDHDRSSSSGVFTDERTDVNDHHRTASKDTLSTLDIVSMESIVDSQISLNHYQTRPMVHRYRLPMPTFETGDDKPVELQREKPIIRFHRAHSAEGMLKDNQGTPPLAIKIRQSSAAIAKKIEKRMPTSRSPTSTLGKAGLVRVANAVNVKILLYNIQFLMIHFHQQMMKNLMQHYLVQVQPNN